jgi:acetyl esterase
MTAMPVHPQVQPLLDAIAAAGGPSVSAMGPEAARAAYRSTFTMVPGDEVELVEDVSIPAPHGAIAARRYVPAGAPHPAPCFVWFHGGGWVLGDLETADATSRRIADRAGAVVVSVDYRRAPEHPFPAANDDALTALRWVHAEAAALGIDPAKVAVGGDSAGGNLAAVLARRWGADDGPPLCHQVLVYPVVDLTMSQPSYTENAEGYFLTRATMQWFIECYAAPEPKDPECSPLHADDLSGLPPAFVLTAEFDPLRDEGDLYAARLAEAGVDVEHVRYPGQVHPFVGLLGIVDDAADALDRVAARLRAAFG